MNRNHFAALLALALPLAAACTATETTPASTDSASAAPEGTMTTPAAPSPSAYETPVPAPTLSDAEDSCNADQVHARWTGSTPSEATRQDIAAAVGERPIRYYAEGDPITMDYNQARLNVVLGKDGKIQEFRCG